MGGLSTWSESCMEKSSLCTTAYDSSIILKIPNSVGGVFVRVRIFYSLKKGNSLKREELRGEIWESILNGFNWYNFIAYFKWYQIFN